MNFDKVKYFYDAGLWSVSMVKVAVRKGVITKAQYKEITGEDYVTPAGSAPTQNEDIESLKTQVASLTEQNAMLEECIVEMAQIVYA